MQEKMPWWKIAVVLFGFPSIYQLYSVTPIASKLFQDSDAESFVPFFLGLTFLHCMTFFICYLFLKDSKWGNVEIGYSLSKKQTFKLIAIYFLIAISLLIFVEITLYYIPLDSEKLKGIGDFFPKNTLQRIVFTFTAFAAGFCEEYIYRGFGIRSLENRKISTWIAVIITSTCFTFIHGIIVFQRFPTYFFPALFFGILFVWTKKLHILMLVHAIIDLSALLMILRAID